MTPEGTMLTLTLLIGCSGGSAGGGADDGDGPVPDDTANYNASTGQLMAYANEGETCFLFDDTPRLQAVVGIPGCLRSCDDAPTGGCTLSLSGPGRISLESEIRWIAYESCTGECSTMVMVCDLAAPPDGDYVVTHGTAEFNVTIPLAAGAPNECD
jgi:hypothetical protein